MIERTEQKVQQKSTHKKEKKTTIEQVVRYNGGLDPLVVSNFNFYF